MEVIQTKQNLIEAIRRLRSQGKRIGLVPTMGALHEGHLSLVEKAKEYADSVVVSIFVNPTQFGPNEDFLRYPRTEKNDIVKLNNSNVSVTYLPTPEEMYPQGFGTSITTGAIAKELCGAFRPGHFDGVATVVSKLLMQVQPDIAVFGEKDFQQLHIIRQVVRDLDIPVNIIGGPILREPDGWAMSSRNRYLSEPDRTIAPVLYQVLKTAALAIKENQPADEVLLQANSLLLKAGFHKIDYISLRDSKTLAPIKQLSRPARLLAAAYLGTTRLIDNIEVLP